MTSIKWAGCYTSFALATTHTFLIVKAARANRIFRNWIQRPSIQIRDHEDKPLHEYEDTKDPSGPVEEGPTGDFSRLPNLESYLRFYYKFSLIFNIYLIIKNTIVSLLDLEAFRSYRYLDCYIIGRFLFNGRVVDMANHFVCFMSLFHIIWYCTIHLIEHKFSLPFAEFLLHDQECVSHWEQRETSSQKKPIGSNSIATIHQAPSRDPRNDYYSTLFHYARPLNYCRAIPARSGPQAPNDSSPKFASAEPPVIGHEIVVAKLRPNRTAKSWLELVRVCVACSVGGYLFSTMVQAFFFRMCLALLFAKRGFELSHINCVRWLVEQRRKNATVNLWFNHKLIFDPPDLEHYEEPKRFTHALEPIGPDLVEFNYYHITRILVNIFENIIIYFEINMTFIGKFIVLALIAKDVLNYTERLNERLKRLLDNHVNLTEVKRIIKMIVMRTRPSDPLRKEVQLENIEIEKFNATLELESVELQAMTADLLYLIESYNKLVSMIIAYLISFWLVYSALVSSWIFIPKSDLPKIEWYILHLFATTSMILLMVPMSHVHRACTRLYKLLASVMAADEENCGNKRTWLALMQFFSPVPLYCFTMLRFVELSHTFALKLILWLASALLVASSFSNPFRQ